MPDLLRIGAVSSILALLLLFVAEAFHGGHEPGDLRATLPVYADNDQWELVHIGQFLGYALLLAGFVALYRSIPEARSAALARLGLVAAVVAVGIYGANQGVDGVAIQFVAEQWVSAPATERADAFRLADAVRHVEIGLTSFTQLTLGIALLLYGFALALGSAYPKLLGWGAIALGAMYVAVGVLVAHRGFTLVGLTAAAGLLLALWLLFLAVNCGERRARMPASPARPAAPRVKQQAAARFAPKRELHMSHTGGRDRSSSGCSSSCSTVAAAVLEHPAHRRVTYRDEPSGPADRVRAAKVQQGDVRAQPRPPIASSPRFSISSIERSSVCVATCHSCPNGSASLP